MGAGVLVGVRGDYRKTTELLPVIEKHLRGGKTLKEIAYLLDISLEAVWKITQRHHQIKAILDDTYAIRYPEGKLRTK